MNVLPEGVTERLLTSVESQFILTEIFHSFLIPGIGFVLFVAICFWLIFGRTRSKKSPMSYYLFVFLSFLPVALIVIASVQAFDLVMDKKTGEALVFGSEVLKKDWLGYARGHKYYLDCARKDRLNTFVVSNDIYNSIKVGEKIEVVYIPRSLRVLSVNGMLNDY